MIEEEKYKRQKEMYELIRSQVIHEDNLVNQRLNWILTSQSFLFASFFAIWTVGFTQKTQNILIINIIMPIMGSLLSYSGLKSIRGAFNAVSNLRIFWFLKNTDEGIWNEDNHPGFKKGEEKLTYDLDNFSKKNFPDVTYKGKNDSASSAALGIPKVIIASWITLFFANLCFLFVGFPYDNNLELKVKNPSNNQFTIIPKSDSLQIQEIVRNQNLLKSKVDSLSKKRK
jgi:hypothetical protein